ncbi:bem46 protein, variant [Mucor velutinosus]|uniref:Bem46 protein, variant n=1 Tax=Mucor velutinosus TaxID=708070 RepID=A0AAN7DCL6_9FUNG|nr:bem46 protein, variant [Mucor velutinosus]
MPGSPIPPNLNPAPPSSTGAAQSIEAPSSDWTSTMTASGSASAPVNASTSTSNKRRRDSMQQDIAGRDYYNNLKQSELIDLVVKLQEQNLILTRLLERSTLTTATNTSAASTNRLNFTPNVNFTRTKSGSAASRYASEKDFPTLNSGTKKGSANAKSTANTATTTANSKKSSGSKKKTSKKSSSKAKVPSDAAEAKKWALRLFSTPTTADTTDGDDMQMSSSSNTATSTLPPPGYTCVYLPCSHKTKHADLRTRLELLKINLKRVYAIQRPAKHVVSLLVHSHYAAEILKICEKDELHPITDFNPISGKNLGDPHLLKTLNAQQLDDKAKAIYYNRMLQAATQLRESRMGLAILKFFNALDSADNHFIPPVIIDEFIKLKPDCVRKIGAANTARSVLKGFDASNLFASLTTSTNNADASISQPGSNPPPLTAASNAGSSPMDTNQ